MRNAALSLLSLLVCQAALAAGRDATIVTRSQWNSSVASDGVHFMTVFAEETASTWSIVAARISRAGRPLDPFGLQVADTTRRADPSIAYGGSTYLIVWTEAEKLWFRRFISVGTA